MLVGAAALGALAATGCGRSAEHPEPDPLLAQLDLARRDSQMARAAAAAAAPFYAPLLTVAADERAAHAEALSREIARVTDETSTMTRPAGPPTTSPAASQPPTRTDVIAALRESADSAAKLAATLDGYRAGLLGSIAAACTAAVTVPLVMQEPTQ